MKKKCFGLIIDINNLGHYMHAHELLITKISNHFEKFYVINVSNCKLTIFKNSFLSWDTLSFNDKDKNEVLKNFQKILFL